MNIEEIKQILIEAERLAHKIANRKSVFFSEGKLGEFFNSKGRDMQTIWKDVVVAYNHFKAIDLNSLVEVYNRHQVTVMRPTREINGNGHTVIFSDECPIKGICHMITQASICRHNQGVSTEEGDFSIRCSYRRE